MPGAISKSLGRKKNELLESLCECVYICVGGKGQGKGISPPPGLESRGNS